MVSTQSFEHSPDYLYISVNLNGSHKQRRGFNEVTSPNGIPYYQSWSGSTPTVNTGADGLGNFGTFAFMRWVKQGGSKNANFLVDNVVAAAKANGLKLIVAL